MDLFAKYFVVLGQGALTTGALFAIVVAVGLSVGVALGHIQYFSGPTARKMIGFVSLILISCPILVLLYWAYFPLQQNWENKLSPFWTSAAVLSLINVVMIMEVTCRGIESMPRNYLSLRRMYQIKWSTFAGKLWFPMLFVVTLHSLLLVELSMLHATLFAALIGTEELFRAALRINAVEIDGTTVFTIMAFVFVLVSLPIHLLANRARQYSKRIISPRNEL